MEGVFLYLAKKKVFVTPIAAYHLTIGMVDMGKVDKKGMDMENRDKLVKVPLPKDAEGVKELRETMLESGKSAK